MCLLFLTSFIVVHVDVHVYSMLNILHVKSLINHKYIYSIDNVLYVYRFLMSDI